MRRLWNKLRSRFGRGVENSLAEEMRLHRSFLEEQYRAEGLSAQDARDRAAREFGSMATALETSREVWSFAWLDALWLDTRYALRTLARERTFAATAVLTLGIGLALVSLAFTLFNAYVLRPFAVADSNSLYEVHWLTRDDYIRMHPWQDYLDIRARRDVFQDVLASRGVFVMGATRSWNGKLVSGNYFRLLHGHVTLGRPIEDRDAQHPMGDNVIVISDRVWRTVFEGDPQVLGHKLILRGHPYEIIGVAGSEFGGLDESPADFWAPISMSQAFQKENVEVEVIGRLRDGVTPTQAEAALASLAAQHQPPMRVELFSRATAFVFSPMMALFFAPVFFALALVVTTCCANVSNMLLARGLARQREIGIRLSVGAGRARLVRQLLTEALIVSVLAGGVGVLLARIMVDLGQRVFFATAAPEFTKLVRLHSLEPDYRVFLFALAAAALCAVGAALMPALQATRPNTVSALRGDFGGGAWRASKVRDGMVVIQVVVCAVLLVCGALLYRRASVFQERDTGMRQTGIINIGAGEKVAEIAETLRRRADVEAVAVVARPPWFGGLSRTLVRPSGHGQAEIAGFNRVSPEYFRVFGISLKSGRWYTQEEARAGAPVAVVSEATARLFWPGQDALGQTLRAADAKERHLDALPITGDIRVIGVAADVVQGWIYQGRDTSCIYLPASELGPNPARELLVQVRGEENMVLYRLRQFLIDRWPGFEGESMPMSTVLSVQIYPFRVAAWMGWVLGLVAMALSVSGMYGVMSFLVSQRSKEIGIRIALGASPAGVVGLVMRRSFLMAGLGVLIGGGFAAAAIKMLVWWSSSLGVLAWDTLALFAGTGIAGAVAVLAALGPSARAARVDPNTVLRAD